MDKQFGIMFNDASYSKKFESVLKSKKSYFIKNHIDKKTLKIESVVNQLIRHNDSYHLKDIESSERLISINYRFLIS